MASRRVEGPERCLSRTSAAPMAATWKRSWYGVAVGLKMGRGRGRVWAGSVGMRRSRGQTGAWLRVGGGASGSTEERPTRRKMGRAPPEVQRICFRVPEKPRLRAPGTWAVRMSRVRRRDCEWLCFSFPFSSRSQSLGENRDVQGQTDGQTHPLCPTYVWPRGRPFLSGPRPLKQFQDAPVWTYFPKVKN